MPRPTQLLLHHHLSQYRGVPYVPRNVRSLTTSSQNRIMLAVENQDGGPLDGVLGYTPRDDVNDSDDAPANEETDMKNEQLFSWLESVEDSMSENSEPTTAEVESIAIAIGEEEDEEELEERDDENTSPETVSMLPPPQPSHPRHLHS